MPTKKIGNPIVFEKNRKMQLKQEVVTYGVAHFLATWGQKIMKNLIEYNYSLKQP